MTGTRFRSDCNLHGVLWRVHGRQLLTHRYLPDGQSLCFLKQTSARRKLELTPLLILALCRVVTGAGNKTRPYFSRGLPLTPLQPFSGGAAWTISPGFTGELHDLLARGPLLARERRAPVCGWPVRSDSSMAWITRTSARPSSPSGSGCLSSSTQSEKYFVSPPKWSRSAETLLACLLADGQLVRQPLLPGVSGRHLQIALRADDPVLAHRVRAVAERERPQPLAGETHDDA